MVHVLLCSFQGCRVAKKSGGRWARRSVEQISNSIYSAKPKQNGQEIFGLVLQESKSFQNKVE